MPKHKIIFLKMWLRRLGFNVIADYVDRESHEPTIKCYARLVTGKIDNTASLHNTVEQFTSMGLL